MNKTIKKSVVFVVMAFTFAITTINAQNRTTIVDEIVYINSQYDHNDDSPRNRRNNQPPRSKRNKPQKGLRRMTVDSVRLAPFKAMEYTIDGQKVRYRAAFTAPSSDAPIIVVYLHSKSGSGNDNLSQMSNRGIYSIYDYLSENKINALMLVPQCPSGRSWAGNYENEDSSMGYNRYEKVLIDSCMSAMGADKTRVFIFGASMGTSGVWHMINDYPGFFAAAFCASGASRDCNPNSLLKTPVYSTIGSEEGERNKASFKSLIDWLNANGGDAKFETLEGLNHPEACNKAFTPERIEWVLCHSKSQNQSK